ncbi:MAG: 50S ribosomal protein L31 [Pseudomonadales bacterium]|nr:50S ribosomal protein L31 [Candidatus Woesebacteria bacterium]MCB9802005.1 50S ribosomal protein L31 [Pseudomonadales bacterium]
MKQGIHPTWHQATVTCSCGNSFTVGSTVESLQVDICSKCHPFFTGEMKFVDRQGRVDRFKKKMEAAAKSKEKTATIGKQAKKKQGNQADPQSYKDILRAQKSEMRAGKTS